MSSSFSENPNNFLPETFIIPDDPEELNIKLYQYLNEISSAVNSKASGLYVTEETITGNKFIPTYDSTTNTNSQLRDVFRVVVDTGALPNTATKLIPHGITTTQDYSVINIYGGATQPGVSTINYAIPIPFPYVPAGNHVRVGIDATNILLTTTSGSFIAYTRSFVVIEYIKLL